jgi:CheY-like chemotaxis protein/DNA-binding XRE family transcriptional regulator
MASHAANPAPSDNPAAGHGQGASRPALKILALDDDADFREYIRSVLEAEGHDVRTAASADEFFAHAELQLPDVVLLDMNMGRESGDQVLTEIRRRWPSMESMRRTLRPGGAGGSGGAGGPMGVFDYLAKPFTLEELRRSLEQAAAAFALGQRPEDRLRHELGRQIRLARTERGWTLKDLSEACGISVSQLSSVERGSHLPSIESLLAIASALDRKASGWIGAAGL